MQKRLYKGLCPKLSTNKKAFILGLNVPKMTAYRDSLIKERKIQNDYNMDKITRFRAYQLGFKGASFH